MNPLTLVAPEVILVLCGLLLLLWEAFGKPNPKTIAWAAIVSYLVAGFITALHAGEGAELWGDLYLWDKLAIFGKFFFLICGIFVTWLSMEYEHRLPVARAEFYTLPLFVTAGLLVLVSANDFIVLFVALELVTVAFYVLVAFQRNNTVALEAGVKYLIMGALSSAFLVMGIAYVFGFTGFTQFQRIGGYLSTGVYSPAIFGMVLILVGLAFKVAAVPFHIWSPDVYQGAPTPITAFLAVGSKSAGFFLLLRVLDTPFGCAVLASKWSTMLVGMAVASLILGNLAALPQRNLKRLLAYSGISHAGFMLLAIASNNTIGHSALLFYLGSYLIASFSAFLVITVVAQDSNGESLHQFSGLAQRSPFLAWALALALISMAGIPPLVGFFGKYLVFLAAYQARLYWPLVVAIACAAAGLFYYIGVIRVMFWSEPLQTQPIVVSLGTRIVLLLLSGAIIVLGIYAQPLISST